MEQKKENPAYITEQLITYIGNKRALLDFIAQGVTYVQKNWEQKHYPWPTYFQVREL